MHCQKCGVGVSRDAKFCLNCGSTLNTGSAPARKPRRDLLIEQQKNTPEAIKHFAKDVAREAAGLSKTAIKSDLGKKMLAGAGIGAIVAVPLPFVGPAVGAVVGAGIVAFRRLTKE